MRVLNFSGRKEEWPTWSEKFLAKGKRSGIKDVLLGKLQTPKTSEVRPSQVQLLQIVKEESS
jgi:hypothetical protein